MQITHKILISIGYRLQIASACHTQRKLSEEHGSTNKFKSVTEHGLIILLKLRKSLDKNYDCFTVSASSCKLASVC